jgi:hypothetical protein
LTAVAKCVIIMQISEQWSRSSSSFVGGWLRALMAQFWFDEKGERKHDLSTAGARQLALPYAPRYTRAEVVGL